MKRDMMDWLTGLGGRLLTLGQPDDVLLEEARNLRQADEIWECTARRARTWITPPDRDPYRPYIVLIVSQHGKVRGTEIFELEPAPSEIIGALAKAMCHPVPGSGGKRRPTSIHVDDADLATTLAPELREVGVNCQFRHTLREVEEALEALEQSFGYEERIASLLDTPGVTPFMVQGFFEAAASFYREAPWRWVDDANPIEIRYPPGGRPHYAVVMGHGGEAYGLAIYKSTDVLKETYAGTPMDQLIGRETWIALLFNQAIEMPFNDLDAIEAHTWPVAGKHAYPLPVQVGLSGQLTRPGGSDLLRLEAALLAIPSFVVKYMRADVTRPQPAEETLKIAMADGEDRIHLSYPVAGLETTPEDDVAFIAQSAEMLTRNAALLDAFEQWMHAQDLSGKTIRTHRDNIERFAQRYLAEEGGTLGIPCPADEGELADIDEFLADWLPYRVERASVKAVKSHMASLKTFYRFLGETNQMSAADVEEILALLERDRGYYLELAQYLEGEPTDT